MRFLKVFEIRNLDFEIYYYYEYTNDDIFCDTFIKLLVYAILLRTFNYNQFFVVIFLYKIQKLNIKVKYKS